MATELRGVNWIGVWEQCQETRRAHMFKGNGKRPSGRGSSLLFSAGSSAEDTAIPSSYHLLTPKKRKPKEDKKKSDSAAAASTGKKSDSAAAASTSSSTGKKSDSAAAASTSTGKKSDSAAGHSSAQKYIHHLESVQMQLNMNDAPKESSRRRVKAKKRPERRKLGMKSGLSTSKQSINLQESVLSADDLLDVFRKVSTVDVDATKEAAANDTSADTFYADGAASHEMAIEKESKLLHNGTARELEGYNISKAGSALNNIEEKETEPLKKCDGDEVDDCLEKSNSLLTLRPVEEQIKLEMVLTNKHTQVTFCSRHNTFLKVHNEKPKMDENENGTRSRGEQRKEDEDKPMLKRKMGLEGVGRPKTPLKRKIGLLAASLGNIILKKQRKGVEAEY